MLPDYVKCRNVIMEILLKRFENVSGRYLGAFNFKKYRIFEGKQIVSKMEDGTIIKTDIKKISGEVKILNEDVKSGNFNKALDYVDQMAKDKALQQSKIVIEEFIKITTQTGQVTDNDGRPFDAEIFFKALEGIQFDFHEDGGFDHPQFVFPPQMEQRAKAVLTDIEKDPLYKKRYDELIERKRQEWRDREASRKLVG